MPTYNHHKDYQFMDVFENLALMMIVKQEVSDYLSRYDEKLNNLQKLRTALSLHYTEPQSRDMSILFESSERRGSDDTTKQRDIVSKSNNFKRVHGNVILE